jgi:hypothetical protein
MDSSRYGHVQYISRYLLAGTRTYPFIMKAQTNHCRTFFVLKRTQVQNALLLCVYLLKGKIDTNNDEWHSAMDRPLSTQENNTSERCRDFNITVQDIYKSLNRTLRSVDQQSVQ